MNDDNSRAISLQHFVAQIRLFRALSPNKAMQKKPTNVDKYDAIERKIAQFSFVKIVNRIHARMNSMLATFLIVTFAFTAVS